MHQADAEEAEVRGQRLSGWQGLHRVPLWPCCILLPPPTVSGRGRMCGAGFRGKAYWGGFAVLHGPCASQL